MKENFVIREERHPGARSILEIAEKGAEWAGGLIFPLWLFTFITGNGTGITIASLLFIVLIPCGIIICVIGLFGREYLTCGFNVNGLQVRVDLSVNFYGQEKVKEFIVNGKRCDIKKWEVSQIAMIGDGHEIELVPGDVENMYMLLDGDRIVENGVVYVDIIHEILSGSPASANQPLPVGTGVMPPFQTTPSHRSAESTVAPRTKRYAIVGQAGVFENRRFDVTTTLVLGRDAAECGLAFPADTAGVSRVHCKLVVEANGLYVYDLGSTYGTVVNNNKTITANQMMKLNHGDTITIGSNQTFVVLYS